MKKKTIDGPRRPSVDYFFIRAVEQEPQPTFLAMIDSLTGVGSAAVVPRKGSCPEALQYVCRFWKGLGCPKDVRFHSDDESSTKELTRKVVEEVQALTTKARLTTSQTPP